MWELLVTLGARARPLLAVLVRTGFRSAAAPAAVSSARGAIGFCSRHPRWSGAAMGVAVVALGWGMLADSTPEHTPNHAGRLTGMDGELIPVLPDVVEPPAGNDASLNENATGPFAPAALTSRTELSPALPLLSPAQPILYQPPPYRPASVASYRREEPQAVWLMGTIEEPGPQAESPSGSISRTASRPTTASRPAEASVPAPWPRLESGTERR